MVLIRLVLTADNHLGQYYAKMPPQVLEERRGRLRRAFEEVVQYALAAGVHLFLSAGDLFDTPNPRNLDREYVADALRRLREAGVRVYGIGGNHDTPRMSTQQGGMVPQGVYHRLGGMIFFPWQEHIVPDVFEVAGTRVAVGGLTPNPTLLPADDPLGGITYAQTNADIRILMLHHSVEGHRFPGENEPFISRAGIAELEGVDYLLVGHVHSHHYFHLAGKLVLFPGSTERTNFGEKDLGTGFVYMELEPARLETLEHIRTRAQPMREVLVRTTELDPQDPTAGIIERLEPASSAESLLKLRLEGPLSRSSLMKLNLKEVELWGTSHNFFFELDTSRMYIEDERRPAGEGKLLSPRAELERYADELIAQAGSQQERELLVATKRRILSRYDGWGE